MTIVTLAYGSELPDTMEKIAAVSDAQIGLLADLREMFQARISLEKDYAAKLQAVVRKANEKKFKRLSKIILGPEPFRSWNEETLKSSTLDQAYSSLIASLESTGQDHIAFADSLIQVMDSMKILEKTKEDMIKKQALFYEKLLSVKEKTAADKAKAKSKERATDNKHAERAAKQLEQQKNDMLNCKNTYLTMIAISNQVKNRFYEHDLVLAENADFITSITEVLQHSQTAGLNHLHSLESRIDSVNTALSQVDPAKDQELFIEYNRTQIPFRIPDDFKFEPCEGFYDTCREKLVELKPLLTTKQIEIEKLQKLLEAYTADPSLGSLQDVRESILEAEHQFSHLSISQAILNAEMDMITEALGGNATCKAVLHIPDSILSSIWGLSKQGKTCKTCHISVHSKCELKVPADCSGADDKLAEHSHTSPSPPRTSETASAETSSDPPYNPSSHSVIHEETTHPNAVVLFDFEASSTFELSISAGDSVQLLEVDDGSGWIKVANSQGHKGLIPASYIELSEGRSVDSGMSGVYGPDELSIIEGETIELTAGAEGGQNYGDGWWEGVKSGRKGIFPSNYVGLNQPEDFPLGITTTAISLIKSTIMLCLLHHKIQYKIYSIENLKIEQIERLNWAIVLNFYSITKAWAF
ncbi:hypothetical protein Clacol_007699 [Clathrus columnatus]|uniref:Uncharacterized protein n=1 Tax=Clathrus columnatus TaxID=1419009 RepID=A0AAV5AKP8_9AGAM|nr:hypothetical protein Clacol_007699 [Clathrus columnatus]